MCRASRGRAGWDASAHTAMEEAVRAVGERTGAPLPPSKPRWFERFQLRFGKKAADAKQSACSAAKPEAK